MGEDTLCKHRHPPLQAPQPPSGLALEGGILGTQQTTFV